MIDSGHLMMAVLGGAILIILGLIPGLLRMLAEGVHNACASLTYRSPAVVCGYERYERPIWLAVTGVALIGAAVLAYVTT